MTAWEIFYQGRYYAGRNKKLWFLLWLMNTMLAAVAALPMFAILGQELNHSLTAAPMFFRFDVDFVSEFIFKYWDAAPFLLVVAAGLIGVYLILTLLATGGTLAVLATPERRFKAAVFFKGCGDYFWRFFRLLIVAAIIYGIFVVAFNELLAAAVGRLTKSWTQEKFVLLLSWGRLLLIAFVFLVVNMLFDYAKVRLVIDPGRSAIMATLRSIKFVYKNFRKTFSVFLLCTLLGLIFIAVYNPVEQILPQYTRRWVVAVFLFQQLFILARVYVRLTFFSSEVILYESLKPVLPSAETVSPAASERGAAEGQAAPGLDAGAAIDPAL